MIKFFRMFFGVVVGCALALLVFTGFAPQAAVLRVWSYIPFVRIVPKAPSVAPVPCATAEPAHMNAARFTDAIVIVGSSTVPLSDDRKMQRYVIAGRLIGETTGLLSEALTESEILGVTDIELLLDSPGGDVLAAFRMAALLATAKPIVHCLVGRGAESAALVLLQGCDDRAASPTSHLMEHYATVTMVKDGAYSAEVLSEMVEGLKESRQLMVEILAERSLATLGVSDAVPASLIALRLSQGDWEMSPAEAVAFGFLDRVVPDAVTFQRSIEN